MLAMKERALTILREYEQAETELLGKAAALTAGTVDGIFLDEFHGLRISISGHIGKWPISKRWFRNSAELYAARRLFRVGVFAVASTLAFNDTRATLPSDEARTSR